MISSISVIIPAYNEEENITSAIDTVTGAIKKLVRSYEIIVVDDGSTDKTVPVVQTLIKNNRALRLIRHLNNEGLSVSVKDGIHASLKEYVTMFHGDNDTAGEILTRLITAIPRADIVSSYMENKDGRTPIRQWLSDWMVMLMYLICGIRLRYYNGFFVCKTALINAIKLESTGYLLYAEAKIKLAKRGCTIFEVPFMHTGRKYGASKALLPKNIMRTSTDLLRIARYSWFGI